MERLLNEKTRAKSASSEEIVRDSRLCCFPRGKEQKRALGFHQARAFIGI
jgi:hypothetical protein